jgi:hypothetical protein
MVDRDELRALAAGTPPAPARVVTLDLACDATALDAPAAALAEARDAGCRTTLRLSGHAEQAHATALLEALAMQLGREGRRLAPEALALPAAVMAPEALALCAIGACAGEPPVYLLVPHAALEAIQRARTLSLASGGEIDARRWWGALLALAASAPSVSLVPEAPGPGLSLLAPGRRWTGPSPGLAELIPAAPCRLVLELDFGALIAASDDHPEMLGRLAGRIVAAADEMLGRFPGPDSPRRLALQLGGIARAVLARGADPRSFGSLTWVKSRLRAFRDGARAASVRLARTRGAGGGLQPFPLPCALEVADTGALDRALLVHGARHSHLVCLSPWSLAPPETGRDCLGLLPALACADSVAWRRPDGECPVAIYSEVLRFAWAVTARS